MEEEKNKTEKPDFTKFILPASIILAGVLISIAIIFSNEKTGGPANVGDVADRKAVSTDDDAYLGEADAPVVLIEFSDYQCLYCRNFWRDTLPMIKSEYINTGKVRFVYRDLPLSVHPAAIPAAQATECAEEQGMFWEMHDKIFSEQDKAGPGTIQFDAENIKSWATEIGLDANKFNSCLDSQKYLEEVQDDLGDGQAAGVSGTPSIFINGKMVIGAQPFSVFQSIIEEELR